MAFLFLIQEKIVMDDIDAGRLVVDTSFGNPVCTEAHKFGSNGNEFAEFLTALVPKSWFMRVAGDTLCALCSKCIEMSAAINVLMVCHLGYVATATPAGILGAAIFLLVHVPVSCRCAKRKIKWKSLAHKGQCPRGIQLHYKLFTNQQFIISIKAY